jgi:hypothetical protein
VDDWATDTRANCSVYLMTNTTTQPLNTVNRSLDSLLFGQPRESQNPA